MKTFDIIKTANKNLFSSKLRTVLTLLALIVGGTTLSLTLALGQGAKDFIDQQTKTLKADDALIITAKNNSDVNPFAMVFGTGVQEYKENTGQFGISFLKNSDIEKIKQVENIKEVQPSFFLQPEYIHTGNSKRYVVSLTELFTKMEPALVSGTLIPHGDTSKMLIAEKFLEPLGLGTPEEAIGKKVKIAMSDPKGDVKEFEFEICGVQVNSFISGGANYVDVNTMAMLFDYQVGGSEKLMDQYFGLFALMDNDLSEEELNSLKNKLGEMGYQAKTYDDQVKQVRDLLTAMQASLSVFGGIAILAATFGIVNTLLMSVIERTREIGLMKALGMKSREIFSIFAFEASSIGFWGGLIGLTLSVIGGSVINTVASNSILSDFPNYQLLQFTPLNLIGVLVINTLIGFLAGSLPALKASRLDPIEALRYE